MSSASTCFPISPPPTHWQAWTRSSVTGPTATSATGSSPRSQTGARTGAGLPENEPDPSTFYVGGARGYTDYRTIAEQMAVTRRA